MHNITTNCIYHAGYERIMHTKSVIYLGICHIFNIEVYRYQRLHNKLYHFEVRFPFVKL